MSGPTPYRVTIDFHPGKGFSVTARETRATQSKTSASPLACLMAAAYRAHQDLQRAGFPVALPGWEDWQVPTKGRDDGRK
jgi:hypothetical protein